MLSDAFQSTISSITPVSPFWALARVQSNRPQVAADRAHGTTVPLLSRVAVAADNDAVRDDTVEARGSNHQSAGRQLQSAVDLDPGPAQAADSRIAAVGRRVE